MAEQKPPAVANGQKGERYAVQKGPEKDPQHSWKPKAIGRLSAYFDLALAVGLAAGMHSIVIAAGLSFFFCTLAVILWELNIGDIRADLQRIEGTVSLSETLVPVGQGEAQVRGNVDGVISNGKGPELA